MAKRGRKSKDFNIDTVTDKNELISMIINQANSLNKKIKTFKKEGIDEHLQYVKHYLTDDMTKYSKNDTVTKSKKYYKDKSLLWLKKTWRAMQLVNNNGYYGTVKKFNKEVTTRYEGLKSFLEQYLREKGYSDDFIYGIVRDRSFFARLYIAFKEGGEYTPSKQLIDKVLLEYEQGIGNLTEKEVNKALNNIEVSQAINERLHNDRNEHEEWLNWKAEQEAIKRNKRKR